MEEANAVMPTNGKPQSDLESCVALQRSLTHEFILLSDKFFKISVEHTWDTLTHVQPHCCAFKWLDIQVMLIYLQHSVANMITVINGKMHIILNYSFS